MRLVPALVALLLVSCTQEITDIPADHVINLNKGEKVAVKLGTANASIGHTYHLLEINGDIAKVERDVRSCGPNPKDGGCNQDVFLNIEAIKTGTMTATTTYCWRSMPPNCDTRHQDPITWTIVVN